MRMRRRRDLGTITSRGTIIQEVDLGRVTKFSTDFLYFFELNAVFII